MKIAWFTPAPVLSFGKSSSGTWMSALYQSLSLREGLELVNIVLQPVESQPDNEKVFTLNSGSNTRKKPGDRLIRSFREKIEMIGPDLVHVWGTEWSGAWVASRAMIKVPVLVSIQGIAGIVKNYVKGTRSMTDIFRWLTVHDLLAPSGMVRLYRNLARAGKMELRAVSELKYFECATPYMASWVDSVNSRAKLFSCPSVLRPPFYVNRWDIEKINRYTLFLPDASTSYKGFDVMLKAAHRLVVDFPALRIRVAGPVPRNGRIRASGYERYIHGLIRKYDLREYVEFLGPLMADKLSREMISAHGVVITSLIESQSLVLLEAMMMGIPAIVSNVGGMPYLFQHLESAIGYPAGDEKKLAEAVKMLFNNDHLAESVSGNATKLSHKRNNQELCVSNMYGIYLKILNC